MKENFYRLLVERFGSRRGISPDDVIVNIVTNADEDWSIRRLSGAASCRRAVNGLASQSLRSINGMNVNAQQSRPRHSALVVECRKQF
jgi:hypothetical protein